MELTNILLFVVSAVSIGYYFVQKRYSFWKNLDVPYIRPTFPFGCLKGVGTKYHISEVIVKHYNEMKNKTAFYGTFFFTNPVFMVTSLNLVKTILVKDFQYFMNRGLYFNEKDDPLSAHLLNIEGAKWKSLRAKLTPTFTSGKMKMMFPTIVSVAGEFIECVKETIKGNPELEVKDIIARYTTDVIGTCAFGLECNSLKDPNAKFREMGRKFFENTSFQRMKLFFMGAFQNLSRKLHLTQTPKDVAEFFMQAVKDTVDYREKNNVNRKDFMSLLLQLKQNGKLDDDTSSSDQITLTVEEIAAQSFIFFGAGFETSSTTMTYSLYELALNQEIQDRARTQVKEILEKHDGKFTYEAVMDMKYIEQIINETLRKYPPIALLVRKVTNDYNVPETVHNLKKGMTVMIPVYAIHHDPEIYPNPEEFNPNRFSEQEIRKRNPYAFLPFGEGPRACIGLRFGLMQARIGLATLLLNFKFSKSSKTEVPLKFSPTMFILATDGMHLHIENIN